MTEKSQKYLSDILHSIGLIEEFTKSIKTFSQYENDLKTQSAVERHLGIIGETVNNYDLLNPEDSLVNARKIVGFRNRLIHAYDAIDPSMIWAIVKQYIQPLKEEVIRKL